MLVYLVFNENAYKEKVTKWNLSKVILNGHNGIFGSRLNISLLIFLVQFCVLTDYGTRKIIFVYQSMMPVNL